jgi:hypothetical protein
MDEPSKLEVGIVKQDRIRRLFKPSKKQSVAIAIILIIVLGLALARFYGVQKAGQVDPDSKLKPYTVSDEAYSKAQISRLKTTTPAVNSSDADKLDYYSELIAHQYEAHDYAGVIESYKAIQQNKKLHPDFSTSLSVIKSYAKIGDKETALKVLQETENRLSQNTANTDLQNSFLQTLKQVKEEITK